MATKNKVLTVVLLFFSIINAVDFSFYGQDYRNLFCAIGFGILAYGHHMNLQSATWLGSALALASHVLKYVP